MKRLVLGILLTSSALPAVAENAFSTELLFGIADQESTYGSESTSGDDASIGIRGALKFNQHIAIELAYQDYGETKDTLDGNTISSKVSTTAINFGAKGMIPFSNGFSLNGRFGIALWDNEIKKNDSSSSSGSFNADDSGRDFYYGVGMQYEIQPQLVFGAEYTIADMDVDWDNTAVDHEVKNFSLSMGLRF